MTKALLHDSALPPRLIVCEADGHWAAALRRDAPPELRVHETRTLAECWQTLARAPASFLVVELTRANVEPLLGRASGLGRSFPGARWAAVAPRAMAECEWLLREAGAVHFVCSTRQAGTLVRAACRHLESAPSAPRSPAERIWDELPWG